jgi:hypothetical protein
LGVSSLATPQHGYEKQINMYIYNVYNIFMNSNWIKFEIDTNKDDMLQTKHENIRRGNKKLMITSNVEQYKGLNYVYVNYITIQLL